MNYVAALRAFVRSVDLGSFSKAADEGDQKVSTVSRYVSDLEADLGSALFNRSTRRIRLTEVGKAFYERAVAILEDIEGARQAAISLNAVPQGLLRINIPGAFGRRHIAPHLKDFLDLYPRIRLDVTLTDATVDLIDSGADLAVRIGVLDESSLIARRLAPQRRVLCCSPAYVKKHGEPREPADLQSHNCLLLTSFAASSWYFTSASDPNPFEVKPGGSLCANDSEALLQTARDGIGIALLPTWLLSGEHNDRRLVSLLRQWNCEIAPGLNRAIWGVYPPKRIVSPKVQVFLTFLAQRFGDPPYWDLAKDAGSDGVRTTPLKPPSVRRAPRSRRS